MLAVIYLIFNEGYGGRVDLAAEAIRLGGALAELMPDEPEAHGLLALMLLHDARREARFADGELVLLRSRTARFGTTRRSRTGARRSTVRSRSAGAGRTCSRRRSPRSTPSELDRLAADRGALRPAGRADGLAGGRAEPRRGDRRGGRGRGALGLVEELELDRYHYFHATRAELLRRLDRADEARRAYERALELVHADAERGFLERRRDGAFQPLSGAGAARVHGGDDRSDLARIRQ